jgi:spore coat polysaccharide biosynthesis protein SpsF
MAHEKVQNVGIVLTARTGSSRIPHKPLQDIGGRRAIEIQIDRLKNDLYPLILAIPEKPEDDILAAIANDKGVECWRGHDDSPLHRLAAVADEYGFEHVVRVTTDDVLVDQFLLRMQIKKHVFGGHDYTYVHRCPEGVAAEVIRTECLKEVARETAGKHIEFVSYYFKKKYDVFEYYPPLEYQKPYRLVMDYPEDLLLLRLLFTTMLDPGTLSIIEFLKKNKFFLQVNHQPEVTVYTCARNAEKYIVDAVKSVMCQTFQDFEYIVYDDCSDDATMFRVLEYLPSLPEASRRKIKLYRGDRNIGLPAACNFVVERAKGKYMARLDADDMLCPEYLQRMVEEAKIQDSNCIISGYSEVDVSGARLVDVNENRWHPGCALMSRWCLNELRFKEGLKYLEGADLYERLKKVFPNKIKFIPDLLWYYRQHDAQKTKQPDHPNNATS